MMSSFLFSLSPAVSLTFDFCSIVSLLSDARNKCLISDPLTSLKEQTLPTSLFQDSRMASVVVGSIQVCFTAVAALIIDKTGRKVLLYISGKTCY